MLSESEHRVDWTHILTQLTTLENLSTPLRGSARLRYTSFSVSRRYIALGANTGAVYIFGKDNLKHLQVVLAEKDSSSVDKVCFGPSDNLLAYSYSNGNVVVVELNIERRGKPERVRLSTEHSGYIVTALQWDKIGGRLFAGDNFGKISVAFVPASKTKDLFHIPSEGIARLDSAIVQLDWSVDRLLVSTITRCYLCYTSRQQYSQIGKKLRDGQFGACFSHGKDGQSSSIYCARPGSRIWEVDNEGTVLNTHQFKQLLTLPPFPIIDMQCDEVNFPDKTDHWKPQGLTFSQLSIISDHFLFCWTTNGLYVLDPVAVKVITWTYNFSGITEVKCYRNEVYLFSAITGQVQKLQLLPVTKCMSYLVLRERWSLAGQLCVYFSSLLMDGQPNRYLSLQTLQDLHEHLLVLCKTELAEKVKVVIEALPNLQDSNESNEIVRLDCGIYQVNDGRRTDSDEESSLTPSSTQSLSRRSSTSSLHSLFSTVHPITTTPTNIPGEINGGSNTHQDVNLTDVMQESQLVSTSDHPDSLLVDSYDNNADSEHFNTEMNPVFEKSSRELFASIDLTSKFSERDNIAGHSRSSSISSLSSISSYEVDTLITEPLHTRKAETSRRSPKKKKASQPLILGPGEKIENRGPVRRSLSGGSIRRTALRRRAKSDLGPVCSIQEVIAEADKHANSMEPSQYTFGSASTGQTKKSLDLQDLPLPPSTENAQDLASDSNIEKTQDLASDSNIEKTQDLASDSNIEKTQDLASDSNIERAQDLASDSNIEKTQDLTSDSNIEKTQDLTSDSNIEKTQDLASDSNIERAQDLASDSNIERTQDLASDSNIERAQDLASDSNIERTQDLASDSNIERAQDLASDSNIKRAQDLTSDSNIEKTQDLASDSNIEKTQDLASDSNVEKTQALASDSNIEKTQDLASDSNIEKTQDLTSDSNVEKTQDLASDSNIERAQDLASDSNIERTQNLASDSNIEKTQALASDSNIEKTQDLASDSNIERAQDLASDSNIEKTQNLALQSNRERAQVKAQAQGSQSPIDQIQDLISHSNTERAHALGSHPPTDQIQDLISHSNTERTQDFALPSSCSPTLTNWMVDPELFSNTVSTVSPLNLISHSSIEPYLNGNHMGPNSTTRSPSLPGSRSSSPQLSSPFSERENSVPSLARTRSLQSEPVSDKHRGRIVQHATTPISQTEPVSSRPSQLVIDPLSSSPQSCTVSNSARLPSHWASKQSSTPYQIPSGQTIRKRETPFPSNSPLSHSWEQAGPKAALSSVKESLSSKLLSTRKTLIKTWRDKGNLLTSKDPIKPDQQISVKQIDRPDAPMDPPEVDISDLLRVTEGTIEKLNNNNNLINPQCILNDWLITLHQTMYRLRQFHLNKWRNEKTGNEADFNARGENTPSRDSSQFLDEDQEPDSRKMKFENSSSKCPETHHVNIIPSPVKQTDDDFKIESSDQEQIKKSLSNNAFDIVDANSRDIDWYKLCYVSDPFHAGDKYTSHLSYLANLCFSLALHKRVSRYLDPERELEGSSHKSEQDLMTSTVSKTRSEVDEINEVSTLGNPEMLEKPTATVTDKELAFFLRCYFSYLDIQCIKKLLTSSEAHAGLTWIALVDCCKEVTSGDVVSRRLSEKDINGAFDSLRPGMLSNPYYVLGHLPSLFEMNTMKTLEYCLEDENHITPLDVYYLSKHIPDIFHRYMTSRYESSSQSIEKLCESTLVRQCWFETLHIMEGERTCKTQNGHPLPGSHLLPWKQSQIIDEILLKFTSKDSLFFLQICLKYGYWLGCLKLYEWLDRREDGLKLVLHLGDVNLFKSTAWSPISKVEWQFVLDYFKKVEKYNQRESVHRLRSDNTLTWNSLALLLADSLGADIGLLQKIKLPSGAISLEFYQALILYSLRGKHQRCLLHNVMERTDTYLWTKKPTQMTSHLHYAVEEEKKNDRDENHLALVQNMFTDLQSQADEVTHHFVEGLECHWGVRCDLNRICPLCGLELFSPVSHSHPGVVVFHCGHGFHKYCHQEKACQTCSDDFQCDTILA